MGTKRSATFIMILMLSFIGVSAGAVENPADPNANLRKLTARGMDPALVEFERIKRMNNEAAILHFTGLIQKTPKDASLYAKRGKAYSDNKDYDKAIVDYDQAVRLDPKLADVFVGRAVAHFFKNNYDKSWEDVHKAESLGGQFWPAFMDALKKSSKREK